MIYFNEIDPYACDWLRGLMAADLIPAGQLDQRSIVEVQPDDVRAYTQCHWFAGIGGWLHALRLAKWLPHRPVWTASCPCQPFSVAGRGLAEADERHLWPVLARLIRECRPPTVVGEQVPGAIGRDWLDGVFADLEGEGYTCGAVVLGAHSVGAPHQRQRLFWVAHARSSPPRNGAAATGTGTSQEHREKETPAKSGRCSSIGGVGNANGTGRQGRRPSAGGRSDDRRDSKPVGETGAWSDFRVIPCRDGKYRRISAQRGDEPLAHGIPTKRSDPRMGYLLARLAAMGYDPKTARRILAAARRNRVGRLKGYGNAIVPQLAAVFLRSVMEILG